MFSRLFSLLLAQFLAHQVFSQRQGFRGGRGRGGQGGWNRHRDRSEVMDVINALFDHRDQVELSIDKNDEGVVVEATSKDEEVKNWIIDHVKTMVDLIERKGGSIRRWDPLFAELLERRDEFESELSLLENGIKIRKVGHSDCAKSLVQWHADAIQAFVDNGYEEKRKPHSYPKICDEDD